MWYHLVIYFLYAFLQAFGLVAICQQHGSAEWAPRESSTVFLFAFLVAPVVTVFLFCVIFWVFLKGLIWNKD